MANHGLETSKHPTLDWKWIPSKPRPLSEALPANECGAESSFRTREIPAKESEAFRFSFPHLARQTSDLHFYRLIKVLNTPLLCLSSTDLGRSDFAYWRGKRPEMAMRHSHVYFWFFSDQRDGDLIVAEYGFDGSLKLRSELKSSEQLQSYLDRICELVNETPA